MKKSMRVVSMLFVAAGMVAAASTSFAAPVPSQKLPIQKWGSVAPAPSQKLPIQKWGSVAPAPSQKLPIQKWGS